MGEVPERHRFDNTIRPDGTPGFSSASWIRRSPKIRPAPPRLGAAGSGFHRHLWSGGSGEAAGHGQGAEVLTNPLNRRKGADLEFLISRTHIWPRHVD